MGIAIIITSVFTLAFSVYCIRRKYIRELLISLAVIFISAFYLISPFLELKVPTLSDIIESVFRPVSELIFDIKE